MKYKVLSNLKRGGQSYVAGDEIELTEEEAKPLVGVVKLIEEEVLEEPESKYSEKTRKELAEIAKKKGVDVSGLKKPEMIEALEAKDAEEPEAPESGEPENNEPEV